MDLKSNRLIKESMSLTDHLRIYISPLTVVVVVVVIVAVVAGKEEIIDKARRLPFVS